MPSEKTEMIRIRCTPETKRRWNILKARLGKNGEDALKLLMDAFEVYERYGYRLI